MKRMLIAGIAALALSGCSTVQSLTSTGPQEQNAVAAAETAYTAVVNIATGAVKTGKLSPAQLQEASTVESEAYNEVVVARQAVANGQSAAVAAALQALQGYEAQLQNDLPH